MSVFYKNNDELMKFIACFHCIHDVGYGAVLQALTYRSSRSSTSWFTNYEETTPVRV